MLAFLQDESLVQKQNFPAAAATAVTGAIDFGRVTLGEEAYQVLVRSEDVPNLADAKTAIFTLQDSADNASFAAINGLGTVTLTGASSAGSIGATQRFDLPATTRRYVRLSCSVLTAGGDSTAKKFWLTVCLNPKRAV